MAASLIIAGIDCQKSSSGPNILSLHWEFRARIRAVQADPRVPGSFIYSGARLRAFQRELFKDYLARNRAWPPVANPDYTNLAGRVGSAHMVQSAGGYKHGNLPNNLGAAYAADWNFQQDVALVDKVLAEYGLGRPVASERWHVVPLPSFRFFGVTGYGDNGDKVTKLQTVLNSMEMPGLESLTVDGLYFGQTAKAVSAYQRALGLPVHEDWAALEQSKLTSRTLSKYAPKADAVAASNDGDSKSLGSDADWRRVAAIARRNLRAGK